MIQNFYPISPLDRGEVVYVRFDAINDSPTYPILQNYFVTRSNWVQRIVTGIYLLNTGDIGSAALPYLNNLSVMANGDLDNYTLTLKTFGNVPILENAPLLLFTWPGVNKRKLRPVQMNIDFENSFIRQYTGTPATTAIPFFITYK